MSFTTVTSNYAFEDIAQPMAEICQSINEREQILKDDGNSISLTSFSTAVGSKTYPVAADFSGLHTGQIWQIVTEMQTGVGKFETTYTRSFFVPTKTSFWADAYILSVALGNGSYGSSWLTSKAKQDLGSVLHQLQEVLGQYIYVQWYYSGELTWTQAKNTNDDYGELCAGQNNVITSGTNHTGISDWMRGADIANFEELSQVYKRYNTYQTIDSSRVIGTVEKAELVMVDSAVWLDTSNVIAYWQIPALSLSGNITLITDQDPDGLRWTTILTSTGWASGVNRTLNTFFSHSCPAFNGGTSNDAGRITYHMTYFTGTGGNSLHNTATKSISDTSAEYTYG
ncbi:MAG: hypothetical protein ACW98X_20055 [Promethearchaeota archaeon]|jgi:hypothetical protein